MEVILLLVVVAAAWFLTRTPTITAPANQVSASGVGPSGVEAAVGGIAGAAACTALGAKSAAGACAIIGAAVAPYVVKGAKAAASGAAAGAKFVGGKVADGAEAAAAGAQFVGSTVYGVLDDPAGSALKGGQTGLKVTAAALKGASMAAGLVDRGLDAAWGNAPTTVKIATAPAYAVGKTGAAVVGTTADIIGGTFGGGTAIPKMTDADITKFCKNNMAVSSLKLAIQSNDARGKLDAYCNECKKRGLS